MEALMKNYILKISINRTNIWRRIAIPQGFTFSQLHDVIQIIFGWENSHLHEFRYIDNLIDREELSAEEYNKKMLIDESEVDLDLILMNEKRVTYLYDLGDSWELSIEVINIVDGREYPRLLEYCGTMLMDNCGGVEGLKECEEKPVNLEKLNIILKGTYAK